MHQRCHQLHPRRSRPSTCVLGEGISIVSHTITISVSALARVLREGVRIIAHAITVGIRGPAESFGKAS